MKVIKTTGTADLTAAALSVSTDHGGPAKLLQVLFHSSVDITETVKVIFDSVDGANYDVELATQDMGGTAKNYVFRPTGDLVLMPGDVIKVTCTFANTTGSAYVTIQLEPLEA